MGNCIDKNNFHKIIMRCTLTHILYIYYIIYVIFYIRYTDLLKYIMFCIYNKIINTEMLHHIYNEKTFVFKINIFHIHRNTQSL